MTLQTKSNYTSLKKHCPKAFPSGQPITFFALQENNGDIAEQRGYKNSNPIRHAKQTAVFMCISDHKSSRYKIDGKWRFGKTKENIKKINFLFLDIDCDSDIEISQDVIIQRCNYYKLPHPSYINKTSSNRFQTLWEFEKPIILNSKQMLSFWESIQRRLYKVFEDLGADINCLDANRYLRNPYNYNSYNKKYNPSPKIKITDFKRKTTLSDLYAALTSDDLNSPKRVRPVRRHNSIPFSESKDKIKKFLGDNPDFEGTYEAIIKLLEIPSSTVYQIMRWFKEDGILKTENIRVGQTWITRFSLLISHTLSKVSITPAVNLYVKKVSEKIKESGFNNPPGEGFVKKLAKIKKTGFKKGFRNVSYFKMIVFIKTFFKKKEFEILNEFRKHLHGFPEKEFEKIIESVFKNNYKGGFKWLNLEKSIK